VHVRPLLDDLSCIQWDHRRVRTAVPDGYARPCSLMRGRSSHGERDPTSGGVLGNTLLFLMAELAAGPLPPAILWNQIQRTLAGSLPQAYAHDRRNS
jgi:hypothetical protein